MKTVGNTGGPHARHEHASGNEEGNALPAGSPAHFTWGNGEKPQRLHGEGITRDISVLGAFIVAPWCPPVDSSIRVEIVLPSLTGLKPPLRFGAGARVVRVEQVCDGKKENGFAIASEDFSQWRLAKRKKKSPPAWRRSVAAQGNWGAVSMQHSPVAQSCSE